MNWPFVPIFPRFRSLTQLRKDYHHVTFSSLKNADMPAALKTEILLRDEIPSPNHPTTSHRLHPWNSEGGRNSQYSAFALIKFLPGAGRRNYSESGHKERRLHFLRSLSLSLSLAFSIALSLPHPEGPLIPEMKKEGPWSSSSMGKEKEDKGAFFAEQRRPFSSSALHFFFHIFLQ